MLELLTVKLAEINWKWMDFYICVLLKTPAQQMGRSTPIQTCGTQSRVGCASAIWEPSCVRTWCVRTLVTARKQWSEMVNVVLCAWLWLQRLHQAPTQQQVIWDQLGNLTEFKSDSTRFLVGSLEKRLWPGWLKDYNWESIDDDGGDDMVHSMYLRSRNLQLQLMKYDKSAFPYGETGSSSCSTSFKHCLSCFFNLDKPLLFKLRVAASTCKMHSYKCVL